MVKKRDPQKHADQKTRFLAQARHLFAAQGVKETSMSQVAGACKITKATLYHYFKSKVAILKEILDCGASGQPVELPWAKARDLDECLTLIAQFHLGQMDQPEKLEMMKLMITETMKNADIRRFYMEFLKGNMDQGARSVAAFLPHTKPEKELRLLFFQFVATLFHYSWNVKMVGDPSDFIGDEAAFVRRLVKTYGAAFRSE